MVFSQIIENGWVIIAALIVVFIAVAGLKANTEEHGGSKKKDSTAKTTETKKDSGENK